MFGIRSPKKKSTQGSPPLTRLAKTKSLSNVSETSVGKDDEISPSGRGRGSLTWNVSVGKDVPFRTGAGGGPRAVVGGSAVAGAGGSSVVDAEKPSAGNAGSSSVPGAGSSLVSAGASFPAGAGGAIPKRKEESSVVENRFQQIEGTLSQVVKTLGFISEKLDRMKFQDSVNPFPTNTQGLSAARSNENLGQSIVDQTFRLREKPPLNNIGRLGGGDGDNLSVHSDRIEIRDDPIPPLRDDTVIPPVRNPNITTGFYKPIPIKDWGIKFSGDSKGMRVQTFIHEMEKMAAAQGVSVNSILSSLHLCLTGDALEWYRASNLFYNWGDFAFALRYTFGRSDCDLTIRRRIEERKQKEGERVGVYISAMKSLFRELEIRLDEFTEMQLVRRNLTPQFRDAILLRDFTALDELEYALHKVEQNILLAATDRPKKVQINSVETVPQVASVSKPQSTRSSQSNQNSRQSKARNQNNSRQNSGRASLCVNCYLGYHSVENCSQPRRAQLLCYGCGAENVTYPNCPNCGSSGEARRVD